jgi:hypothetical protein
LDDDETLPRIYDLGDSPELAQNSVLDRHRRFPRVHGVDDPWAMTL